MHPAIKRFLPRSLFGRSLLILVTPVVLLQIVATYVFYVQHWDTMSKRLSAGVSGDIAMVIDVVSQERDRNARHDLFELTERHTGIRLRFVESEILPNAPRLGGRSSVGAMLGSTLEERTQRPYQIDDDSDDRNVMVAVQLPDGVLHAMVPRKRLFSSTTYVFILWMIGTSLILFAIAGVFLRNQVRPIRRLAAAAESFGKGHDIPDFKPEGATEVRRAAMEFNHMRERITRAITQRTAMLAGVSHDLRTPLTRLKLQLAMMGESPDIEDMKTDVAEMETMLDAYLAFVRGEGGEAVVTTELKPLLEEVVGGAGQAQAQRVSPRHHQPGRQRLPLRPHGRSRRPSGQRHARADGRRRRPRHPGRPARGGLQAVLPRRCLAEPRHGRRRPRPDDRARRRARPWRRRHPRRLAARRPARDRAAAGLSGSK